MTRRLGTTIEDFEYELEERADSQMTPRLPTWLDDKQRRRSADERARPLASYRANELSRMAQRVGRGASDYRPGTTPVRPQAVRHASGALIHGEAGSRRADLFGTLGTRRRRRGLLRGGSTCVPPSGGRPISHPRPCCGGHGGHDQNPTGHHQGRDAPDRVKEKHVMVVSVSQQSGKGLSDGLVSELTCLFTVKPGHAEQMRAAAERFVGVVRDTDQHTTHRTGLRDVRLVMFDDDRRLLLSVNFETD